MGDDEDLCVWSQDYAILGPKWSPFPLISGTLLEFTVLCKAREKILDELGPRTGSSWVPKQAPAEGTWGSQFSEAASCHKVLSA